MGGAGQGLAEGGSGSRAASRLHGPAAAGASEPGGEAATAGEGDGDAFGPFRVDLGMKSMEIGRKIMKSPR